MSMQRMISDDLKVQILNITCHMTKISKKQNFHRYSIKNCTYTFSSLLDDHYVNNNCINHYSTNYAVNFRMNIHSARLPPGKITSNPFDKHKLNIFLNL